MPALGTAGLDVLATAVESLDPEHEYVHLDVKSRHVWYCPDITTHEALGAYSGEEEPTRAYLVAWLIRVGGYAATSIELEKRYPSGRGQVELDIRVADSSGRAYALIEVKSPDSFGGVNDPYINGQLYAPAAREPGTHVLSLATVALIEASGSVSPLSVTIDYPSWPSYEEWDAGGKAHRDDIPLNYGEATIEPYVRGETPDLNHDTSQPDLDRLRQRLHDRLWGGSNDDNAIYAWLVKVFLTKIHDEKVTDDGQAYACQVMHKGSRPESSKSTAARVNKRWKEAYRKYISGGGPDPDALDDGLFNASDLSWVVEMLQGHLLDKRREKQGRFAGWVLRSYNERWL